MIAKFPTGHLLIACLGRYRQNGVRARGGTVLLKEVA